MSPVRAALHAAAWLTAAALVALAIVLASCTPPMEAPITIGDHTQIHGMAPDAGTFRLIADCLDVLPELPWASVGWVDVSADGCGPTMNGCYDLDRHEIRTVPDALCHELLHAALYGMSGDPDYEHTTPGWAAADGVKP